MNQTKHPVEREEVMAYLDGELEATRAAAVAAHMEGCGECAALAGDLRGVSQQMREWQVEPASPALSASVHAAAKTRANVTQKKRLLGMRPWVWQLGAVAALALLVVAVSIPNLGRSRITANQTSAVGALRTLNTACIQYAAAYGGFPQGLKQLGPGNPPSKDAADLIDGVLAEGTKSGYRFTYTPGSMDASGKVLDYSITAEPVTADAGGQRCFYTDESGVIRVNPGGPANANSAPLDGPQTYAYNAPPAEVAALRTGQARTAVGEVTTPLGPMIIRSAALTIVTKEFENARAAMEQILRGHNGYVAQLSTRGSAAGKRSLNATVRVPASKLDVALADIKKLGRVESESLGGEEVTKQHADLVSRQANARNTEKRLTQVLENRTGKVADVLSVEREIARVREEIERMDAQRKNLENQVAFATVQLRLEEEYQAQVNPAQPSAWLLIRNAAVEGYRSVVDTGLGLVLFILSAGPSLLFWALLLAWPVRKLWRKFRALQAAA